MQVRDAQIIRLIERIGDYYRENISNRFVRPLLLQLSLEKQTWDLIEVLMEKVEQYRYQGYDLEYLYKQVSAIARLVQLCRRDILPNIRTRIAPLAPSGAEKVLWDMAVNNFASNLQVFVGLVLELYESLINLDKTNAKNRPPLYSHIPELEDITRLLTGH